MLWFARIALLYTAAAVQAAAQASNGAHVAYQDAPSYYPGSPWSFPAASSRPHTCHVVPAANGGDSAPAILKAFSQCGRNGRIVFDNTTYHVNSVMETTGMSNVEVDIRGTLLWSTNITYWLSHSLPMGYQNQSTAWIFGGDQVYMHGHGYGTLNGNGEVWYEFDHGQSNYPRRPHQITFNGLTNSVIESMRFIRSQMWTMTLIHSSRVLLQDIYVNNTNTQGGPEINTDGADTIYSDSITFARWVIDNGDDGISWKANSTNVLCEDITQYQGTGFALGSIGQFKGHYETIENIRVNRATLVNTHYGAYAKTWTGVAQGYPPNGGGGGTGYMKNIQFENFHVQGAQQLWYITQCNSYIGATAYCDSSHFQISDISLQHMSGTLQTNTTASMQCSGAAPCYGIAITDTHMTVANTGSAADAYLCSDVVKPVGFTCNGLPPQT